MEKASQPLKTIFHRLSWERPGGDGSHSGHLRPLSVYSRMITCEHALGNPSANRSWMSSSPFCNLKIEIVNVSKGRKRRLDDSCLDDTFETPFKQTCIPNAVSPDLACVIDSCDPLPDIDIASSATVPRTVSPNDNSFNGKGALEAVVSVPNSELPQSRNSEEADGREKGVVPSSSFPAEVQDCPETPESNPDKVTLDLCPVFNFDIDDIMCLSPIDGDSDSNESIDAFIESCHSFCALGGSCKPGDSHQNKPSPGQCPSKDQGARKVEEKEQGEGDEEGREGEPEGKEVTGKQDDGLNDEGYFSRSYLEALRAGKGVSEAETPLLPQTTSSPFVREREVWHGPQVALLERVEEKRTLCCPEPHKGQAVTFQTHFSFCPDDLSYSIVGAALPSPEGSVEGSEGTAGDVWTIGAPIRESSVCHSASEAPGVFYGERGGEAEGYALSSGHGCQVTLVCEEMSYEHTVPLQVQVRTAVGVPSAQSNGNKVTRATPPEKQIMKIITPPEKKVIKPITCRGKKVIKPITRPGKKVIKPITPPQKKVIKPTAHQKTVPRPAVFDREEEWQREKRLYVDSVTRHMEEHAGAGHGVISELRNLMNHVGYQGPDRYWRQHPSDLTCRNYQARFGNETPMFSLDDWQHQNYLNHRRFAKVPKVFKRSPIP